MGGSVADECHIFLNFSLRDTIVDLMPKQSKNLCICPLEDFKIIFIPISSPSLIFFLSGRGICAESLTEKIIYTYNCVKYKHRGFLKILNKTEI